MIRYSHNSDLCEPQSCGGCGASPYRRYKPADGGASSHKSGGLGFRYLTACSVDCAEKLYLDQEWKTPRTGRAGRGKARV